MCCRQVDANTSMLGAKKHSSPIGENNYEMLKSKKASKKIKKKKQSHFVS
jgi:hypothetical protein